MVTNFLINVYKCYHKINNKIKDKNLLNRLDVLFFDAGGVYRDGGEVWRGGGDERV